MVVYAITKCINLLKSIICLLDIFFWLKTSIFIYLDWFKIVSAKEQQKQIKSLRKIPEKLLRKVNMLSWKKKKKGRLELKRKKRNRHILAQVSHSFQFIWEYLLLYKQCNFSFAVNWSRNPAKVWFYFMRSSAYPVVVDLIVAMHEKLRTHQSIQNILCIKIYWKSS